MLVIQFSRNRRNFIFGPSNMFYIIVESSIFPTNCATILVLLKLLLIVYSPTSESQQRSKLTALQQLVKGNVWGKK